MKVKAWLLLGLIFVVGMVTGSALTFGFRSAWMHPLALQQIRYQWLAGLTARLNLTPDQQAKVQPILVKAGNSIQSVHREEVDKISHIMEEANAEIAPLLTAEQKAGLQKMESERRRDFSRHLRPWAGPHGMPPDATPPNGPPNGPNDAPPPGH